MEINQQGRRQVAQVALYLSCSGLWDRSFLKDYAMAGAAVQKAFSAAGVYGKYHLEMPFWVTKGLGKPESIHSRAEMTSIYHNFQTTPLLLEPYTPLTSHTLKY